MGTRAPTTVFSPTAFICLSLGPLQGLSTELGVHSWRVVGKQKRVGRQDSALLEYGGRKSPRTRGHMG